MKITGFFNTTLRCRASNSFSLSPKFPNIQMTALPSPSGFDKSSLPPHQTYPSFKEAEQTL